MLSRKQRTTLGEKLMDAANISLGALVFGPFISCTRTSVVVGAMGVIFYILLSIAGIALSGDSEGSILIFVLILTLPTIRGQKTAEEK